MALVGPPRQAVALALVLVLPLSLAGPDVLAATAGAMASVEGRLVLADGNTPWSGAVLQVSPVDGDTVFESRASDAKGRFRLADLPAGDYVFSVRDDRQVYRLGPGVRLAPGKHEDVLLGLSPAVADDGEKGEDGEDDDWDDEDAEGDPDVSLIKNPLSITLIALSGLTLAAWGIDELDDDDKDDEIDDLFASPSSP